MSILILGGTSWLGATIARHALADGHDVVCLARGESGPVPAGARLVRADRSQPDAYAALPPGPWDLVVDLTRQPGQARSALEALSDRAQRWVLVSSGSVYADHSHAGGDLTTPLLPAFVGDESGPEQYGEAKVACEAAVTAHRGADALIARSGLIAGHGDLSDRFGYWVGRFALAQQDGGPVLVPVHLERGAQYVDVVDLASWVVGAGLRGVAGVVDAYGPRRTLGEVLSAAALVAGFDGEQVTMSDADLVAAGVEQYMGPRSLALWLHDPEWLGFSAHEDASARAAGLLTRPLEATTRDALEWEEHLGLGRTGRRAGLDREDEIRLISGVTAVSAGL
ncbi:MAG: NAD-dependent epimerase/dehydratase family protein [Lapillicoccus sp.]